MSPEPDDQLTGDELTGDAITVTDNPLASRYELHVAGELAAFTNYRVEPGRIVFTHTETLDAFKGHGVATHLARAVLDADKAVRFVNEGRSHVSPVSTHSHAFRTFRAVLERSRSSECGEVGAGFPRSNE